MTFVYAAQAVLLVALVALTIERGGRAFVARALAPWVLEAPADRDVATEEALVDAKRAIVGRVQWLRIGGTLASLTGFVGAAIALGSIYYGDHQGLEALDPVRMQRRALAEAAMAIALGMGGSVFALGAWAALRVHARRLVSECDRAVDRLRAR